MAPAASRLKCKRNLAQGQIFKEKHEFYKKTEFDRGLFDKYFDAIYEKVDCIMMAKDTMKYIDIDHVTVFQGFTYYYMDVAVLFDNKLPLGTVKFLKEI